MFVIAFYEELQYVTIQIKDIKSRVNAMHNDFSPIGEVIYQKRETVFHRDIQTPRTELKIFSTHNGVFLTKFEALG